jgi:hypothetical protein
MAPGWAWDARVSWCVRAKIPEAGRIARGPDLGGWVAAPRRGRVASGRMASLTRRLVIVAGVAALSIAPAPALSAQDRSRPLPEFRVDVVTGRATAVQAGAGLIVPSGLYLRYVLAAAAGPAWRSGAAGASGRVDLQARFLLDPFRESRWGLYGVAGLGALYDRFERWRARVTLAVGVEAPASARGAWAVEVGLGGGARVGIALRRLALGRR